MIQKQGDASHAVISSFLREVPGALSQELFDPPTDQIEKVRRHSPHFFFLRLEIDASRGR
jgi:hypothetical protein